MHKYPPIQIVDENDQPIGESDMESAWKKGQWHRIVRIMVQTEDGSLLLQLRSPQMKVYPNHWDHSAAGHVDAGESWKIAAKRELKEETGITGVELEEIYYYKSENTRDNYHLKRFNRVYLVKLDKGIKLKKQDEEVTELRWFSIDEVKQMLTREPEKMTPALRKVLVDCNFV